MIVNQANLHGLAVGYSTAYNKSFEATQSNYQKIATTVPSTTGEQDYKWLGQIHHSQEVIVEHSKYSGTVVVEKTIVRSDDSGAVHMYIYWR